MNPGIFSKTFVGTPPMDLPALIRSSGYGCTQLNMSSLGLDSLPLEIDASLLDRTRSAFVSAEVSIVAISATYNMIHPDLAQVERGRRSLRAIVEASPRLGTNVITLCTGTLDASDQWRAHPGNGGADAWRALLAEMERVIDLTESRDVALGIEPEPSNVVASADLAVRLLAELGSPRLKIVFDPANLVRGHGQAMKDAMSRDVDLLAGVTAIFHAQNRSLSGTPSAPGRGIVDMRWLLEQMQEAGFEGPVIAHGFGADEAEETATFLRGLSTSATERSPG